MIEKIKNIDLKKSVLGPGLVLFIMLFLLNAISKNWFFRWDLTDNKQHSLSISSKSIIGKIDDYLNIKAYADGSNHEDSYGLASTFLFI